MPDSRYTDNLIDEDEVPELSQEEADAMVPFSELPQDLQASLNELIAGNITIRPETSKQPVSITLSTDVVDRLKAQGDDWQVRVEDVLRDWLDKHPESGLAKAS